MKDAGNKIKEAGKSSAAAGLGLLFWLCTGGLMSIHLVSYFMGITGLPLAIFGFFVAPVGLVNAVTIVLTGDSLGQYF